MPNKKTKRRQARFKAKYGYDESQDSRHLRSPEIARAASGMSSRLFYYGHPDPSTFLLPTSREQIAEIEVRYALKRNPWVSIGYAHTISKMHEMLGINLISFVIHQVQNS